MMIAEIAQGLQCKGSDRCGGGYDWLDGRLAQGASMQSHRPAESQLAPVDLSGADSKGVRGR